MQSNEQAKRECHREIEDLNGFYRAVPDAVEDIWSAFAEADHSAGIGAPFTVPSLEAVVRVITLSRELLFPEFFIQSWYDPHSLKYAVGQRTKELFEHLSQQIMLSVRHDCLRDERPCSRCQRQGHEKALSFLRSLPRTRRMLVLDVEAAMEGDPAAKSFEEVLFSYPGVFALLVHRLANLLVHLEVPLLPRMMSEHAHSLTGIDINPAASIGEHFFMDHGTGIVVGESTVIGDRVRIYQGVTLGAHSLPRDAGERYRDTKRHPTIEDDVIIYSNATILGGTTVIGARSIIGGNVWLTESVPPDTKVLLKRPELRYIGSDQAPA
jgi:serine O-acetyltransferase